MKKVIILALFFFFSSSFSIFAESAYVLPYPSTMPGSFFYKVHQCIEVIEKYWYFGNFGQFTYNLEKADKYLIEAKTLFEYRQYLLGYKALEKSSSYFQKIRISLNQARIEGKNISEKKIVFREAGEKHKEVLEKIKLEVPAEFIWADEKATPISLPLYNLIDKSIDIRSNMYE